jgi:hypothetical protein
MDDTIDKDIDSKDATQAAWDAGLASLQKAPSDEGVVVSGNDKTIPAADVAPATSDEPTEPDKTEPPAEVKPWVNLGGLSTDELLRRVREEPSNPDNIRALELRLKRQDASAAGNRKAQQHGARLAEQAAQVKEAMDSLNTDYPELAKPLQKISDFAQAASQPFIEQERQQVLEEGKALVESAFPNFTSVISGQEFAGWIQSQPQRVRELASQGGPSGAMDVLTLYEQHAKQSGKPSPFEPQAAKITPQVAVEDPAAKAAKIAADRKARLQQSSPVPSGAVVARQSSASDDPQAQWNAALEELRRKKERNRI